jgi:hypothetical protein
MDLLRRNLKTAAMTAMGQSRHFCSGDVGFQPSNDLDSVLPAGR